MVDGIRDFADMMEERFGAFGRYFTNIIILALGLFIIGLAADMIRRAIVTPMLDLIREGFGSDVAFVVGQWLFYFAVVLPLGIWFGGWLIRKLWWERKIGELLQIVEGKQKALDEGTAEFDAHVRKHVEDGEMHFVISSDDAADQWPELEKKLDEYLEQRHAE